MTSGIYKIVNKVNGKCYVGSCIDFDKRVVRHIRYLRRNNHHSLKLQNAWIKYGEENFEFVFLEYAPKNDLLKREQHWIDTLNTHNMGYNICPKAGSCLGVFPNKKTREKMSKWQIGKKHSEETKLKILKKRMGVKQSDGCKEKKRAISTGKRFPARMFRSNAKDICIKKPPDMRFKKNKCQ